MSSPTTFVQGSEELEAGRADLQAEAHCPVCKKDFKNPLTIQCEHNFCLACISESWKDLKDSFPCPVCHFNCTERNFQSNEQLGTMTEVAKPLPVRESERKRQEGNGSYETHQQLPAISCEKDQEVSCPQRSLSPSPKSDSVWPIENASHCHKKHIEDYVKLWRERVEPAEKTLATQRRRLLELKKRTERQREQIKFEYQQYRLFICDKKENILGQLQNEEKAKIAKLCENLAKFSDHISSLKCLLREVKSKRVKSELELLASVKDCYEKHRNLICPDILSLELRGYGYTFPPQYSDLDRIIKRFQVDVLLDPKTANCILKVSEDKKTVQREKMQRLPRNPKRFRQQPVVLGSEGYSSGRQYWEVDVEHKSQWILGVCKEPFPRGKTRSGTYKDFSVKDGLWGVGLNNSEKYLALGHKELIVVPRVAPNRVGIFLDSEMHEVTFYNLHDKSLLYSFSNCASGALWPYFYVGYDFTPLKICTVEDPEW